MKFYFSIFLMLLLSCKNTTSVVGSYKMKEYTKTGYFINGLLYSKKNYIDYALFNNITLNSDLTFTYVTCKVTPVGNGRYEINKNNIRLVFETGILENQSIVLKVKKNKLKNIKKTDSINTIYNLIKIE